MWWEGDPPDGSLDVIMDMSQADFLKVYSGTASAAAVSKMVLSGRLYVVVVLVGFQSWTER